MGKLHITKLSDSEFHFEYEDKEQIKDIKALKQFEYEGRHYKVLRAIETFDLSGYHAFMMYVRPKGKLGRLFKSKRRP